MAESNMIARALAECAFKQHVAGRSASFERLLAEAEAVNAAEAGKVLREHGIAHRTRPAAQREEALAH